MTQKDKYLLIKDLCSRLPYGVVIEHVSGIRGTLHDLFVSWRYNKDDEMYKHESNTMFFGDVACDVTKFKPYLFPMSSMTEEQKKEYCSLQQKVIYNSKGLINSDVMEYVNWCYKNHIDINNLIPVKLALDASGLNIY